MNHKWSNPCHKCILRQQKLQNHTQTHTTELSTKKKKLKKLHCGYEKQRGSSRTWNIAAQFAFHAASARRAPSPLTPDMVNHIQIPHLWEKAGDWLIVCSTAFYTSCPSMEKHGKKTLFWLITCTKTTNADKSHHGSFDTWEEQKT